MLDTNQLDLNSEAVNTNKVEVNATIYSDKLFFNKDLKDLLTASPDNIKIGTSIKDDLLLILAYRRPKVGNINAVGLYSIYNSEGTIISPTAEVKSEVLANSMPYESDLADIIEDFGLTRKKLLGWINDGLTDYLEETKEKVKSFIKEYKQQERLYATDNIKPMLDLDTYNDYQNFLNKLRLYKKRNREEKIKYSILDTTQKMTHLLNQLLSFIS